MVSVNVDKLRMVMDGGGLFLFKHGEWKIEGEKQQGTRLVNG